MSDIRRKIAGEESKQSAFAQLFAMPRLLSELSKDWGRSGSKRAWAIRRSR